MHSGDIEQARETFWALVTEYPESTQAAEADFFIGYCYILQSKFKEASEALARVVKNYPDTSYAEKAGMYLKRIENMTDEEN